MTTTQRRCKPVTLALTSILISILSVCPIAKATSSEISSTLKAPEVLSNVDTTGTISPPSTDATLPPSKLRTQSTTPTTIKPIANPTSSVSTTENKPLTITHLPNPNAPLNAPNVSDEAVLSWASNVAKLAYSYDFKNYNKQIQQIKDHFTPQGWIAFMNALNKSNNLNVVQNRKLVASAINTGKPTIIAKGVQDGLYTWQVHIPLLATYESESRLIKQNLDLTLLIVRDSSRDGLGISHFVAILVPASQPITAPPTENITAPTTGEPISPTATQIPETVPATGQIKTTPGEPSNISGNSQTKQTF